MEPRQQQAKDNPRHVLTRGMLVRNDSRPAFAELQDSEYLGVIRLDSTSHVRKSERRAYTSVPSVHFSMICLRTTRG
jgi:hypothetical protein